MGIFCKDSKVVFAVGHLLESETLNTSKMACGHVSEDDFASMPPFPELRLYFKAGAAYDFYNGLRNMLIEARDKE